MFLGRDEVNFHTVTFTWDDITTGGSPGSFLFLSMSDPPERIAVAMMPSTMQSSEGSWRACSEGYSLTCLASVAAFEWVVAVSSSTAQDMIVTGAPFGAVNVESILLRLVAKQSQSTLFDDALVVRVVNAVPTLTVDGFEFDFPLALDNVWMLQYDGYGRLLYMINVPATLGIAAQTPLCTRTDFDDKFPDADDYYLCSGNGVCILPPTAAPIDGECICVGNRQQPSSDSNACVYSPFESESKRIDL